MAHYLGETYQEFEEEIMSMKFFFIMVMMVILGCASTGRQFDTTAIDRIDVGKTTESEVISMLSMPMSITKCSNGINIYNYSYGESYFFGMASSVNSLEIQLVDGVVINKWQNLEQY
jgi:hypothetical protein